MKKTVLTPWGPWKDNPSKPENFYESFKESRNERLYEKEKKKKEEDYCKACDKLIKNCTCNEEDSNKEEEISEDVNINVEQNVDLKDPYAQILKNL